MGTERSAEEDAVAESVTESSPSSVADTDVRDESDDTMAVAEFVGALTVAFEAAVGRERELLFSDRESAEALADANAATPVTNAEAEADRAEPVAAAAAGVVEAEASDRRLSASCTLIVVVLLTLVEIALEQTLRYTCQMK